MTYEATIKKVAGEPGTIEPGFKVYLYPEGDAWQLKYVDDVLVDVLKERHTGGRARWWQGVTGDNVLVSILRPECYFGDKRLIFGCHRQLSENSTSMEGTWEAEET